MQWLLNKVSKTSTAVLYYLVAKKKNSTLVLSCKKTDPFSFLLTLESYWGLQSNRLLRSKSTTKKHKVSVVPYKLTPTLWHDKPISINLAHVATTSLIPVSVTSNHFKYFFYIWDFVLITVIWLYRWKFDLILVVWIFPYPKLVFSSFSFLFPFSESLFGRRHSFQIH